MSDTFGLQFYDTQKGVIVGTITGDNQVTIVEGPDDTSAQLTNCTSINIEKDYFVPSNGLTFVIETPSSLNLFLQIGYQVRFTINGNPNMVGYIFDYDLTYSRTSGSKLTIRCKDLLEYMAQGSVPPNITNANAYNYHFNANTTLKQALTQITNTFQSVTGTIVVPTFDGSQSLSVASGFDQGLPVRGKTPKSRTVSFTKQLNKLIVPSHGESYLAYFLRISKHVGCNVKMDCNNSAQIIVKPPTYDWTNNPDLFLIHRMSDGRSNNVLGASMHYGFDHQPSVVIVDTSSSDQFYRSSIKGIAFNELTAYPIDSEKPIASVFDYTEALIQGKNGTGYKLVDFNTNLYAARKAIGVDVKTNVCLPFYCSDRSANTPEEAAYAASKILAEAQDKYLEYTCQVVGWTTTTPNGEKVIWQPDYCVTVIDEEIGPNPFQLWIRKVSFTLTRDGSMITHLFCILPYCHGFEITE